MTTLLRTVLGTTVYALIVALAAPFPSAAGLMLVFPTLNGLAYLFSDRRHLLGMARSMIWMPVVNGVLCFAFLAAFVALAPRVAPGVLAWALLAAGLAAFVALVQLPCVRRGIADGRQVAFALLATIVGLALALALHRVLGASLPPASPEPLAAALAAVSRNAPKIAVFAACLAAFLVASEKMPMSDATRGILAGLPFAPFGGLVSIAADTGIDLDARLAIMREMTASLPAGPAIAIWFIHAVPRALLASPAGGWRPAALLGAAWIASGLAVLATTAVLG